MNDIYELLNDAEMDLSQFDETRLSKLESRRIKTHLKNKIRHKSALKRIALTAAIFTLILFSAVEMIDPGLVYAVPVVKSIIGQFMEFTGANGEYDKYTQIINRSKTSNGITFTLNEVALDNSVLQLAYTLKTDGNIREINNNANGGIQGFKTEYYINGMFLNASSNRYYSFLDDHSCRVLDTLDISRENLPDKFYLTAAFAGTKFNFIVSKKEMLKEIREYNPGTTFTIGDSKIKIDKISISPLTTTLNYSSDSALSPDCILQDDNGRVLQMIYAGGSDGESGSKGNMTFRTISSDTKKLTFIPSIYMGGASIDYKELKNQYPIVLNQNKLGKLIINNVEFKDDKIIIHYTAEGMAPSAQADQIGLYDENKKLVMPVMDTWRNKVRDESKPLDFTAEFQKVDSSKFYIGTNDFSGYEFTDGMKIVLDIN